MGGQNKLYKFDAIGNFPNVIEHKQEDQIVPIMPLKGKWNDAFFKNDNPIVLELGCGKGEYTVALSQLYPHKNFIGCDIKGNRIYTGAKQLLDLKSTNAGFMRGQIENINTFFDTNEVAEIWITFPDPQPQKPRERNRLTHPNFLNKYRKLLQPNGIVHLKTDSQLLYEYTKEVIAEQQLELLYDTNDLYANTDEDLNEMKQIKTYYEALFSGKGYSINYLRFRL
ncbi:MAG: tRNA (guanosine(46)-N7)-methyltransferase TrmB [Bacteroidia bacterium]|jgi:tRNA (guanine-N7-)-methyltransferase